jgi:uncharacterized damage-inducible protein DinB
MDAARFFVNHSAVLLSDEFLPRIRVAVMELTDEQVWWRPNEASNSIGNLILHLSGNVAQWISGGVGGQTVTRERQKEFDERSVIPRTELLGKLQATVEGAVGVLTSLDLSILHERRTIQGNDVAVLEAIYHVVEHFAMHTGQILMLTKMITAKDLRMYEFPDGTARKRW